MNIKTLKYLSPATIYVLAFIAFNSQGWLTWSPMLYAWVIIPVVELLIKPDEKNMNAAEEELAKKIRPMTICCIYLLPFNWQLSCFFYNPCNRIN